MVIRQNEFSSEQHMLKQKQWDEACRIELVEKLNEELTKDHKEILLGGLVDYSQSLVISSYTNGDDLSKVAEYANDLIKDTTLYAMETEADLAPDRNLEQYINCIWLLSFCYFFSIPEEDVAIIAEHIPFAGNDRLTDYLISASIPEHPVETKALTFPDVYQPLMDAIGLLHEPDAYNQKIQQFLEGYYPGLKEHDVTWHDSHKEKDPERCFHFGYWIFELPALLLSTNILDDSAVRGHPFYPKDLADWKKERILATWKASRDKSSGVEN